MELTDRNSVGPGSVVLLVIVAIVLLMPVSQAQGAPDVRSTRAGTSQVDPGSGDGSGSPTTETTLPGDDPDQSGGTTTSTTSTSSSTTVPDPVTDTSVTTTTVPYLPPVPPELVDDPRLPFLVDPDEGTGIDIPIAQTSFDPLSVAVLPERIGAIRARIDEESIALADAIGRLADLTRSVARLEERLDSIGGRTRQAIRRAADAREALRDHAVLAYTQGRGDLELSILAMSDAVDIGVAKEYVSALMGRQADLAEAYARASKDLDARGRSLANELGVERSKLSEVMEAVSSGNRRVGELKEELAAYELGAHVYVAGFVFPLASEAEFIDSWGYPRMVGTASEHWHQGTDIFAPYGAPAVASENGVIERLGQASLGGNKLWVRGDSGMRYYYAHLSAFAEGMENGRRVRAGEVVGYVGDTGNAKGTSPHLHFETHPAEGDVVNAYPLLRAAYGNRGAFRAVVELPVPPVVPVPEQSVGG